MAETKLTPEEALRIALTHAAEAAERLSDLCRTTEELAGVCKLALENDGQLRVLLALFQGQGKR